MGVKNLWDILECCKKTLPLQHLQNKRVCVDLSCWMVQFQSVCRSASGFKEKLYLQSLFHRLRALIALNCSLIFVTDGSIPAIKLTAYRRRLGATSEATGEDLHSHLAPSLRRNMGSGFSCMIKEAKALGATLGIPCLDGLEEAEAQCASLNMAKLCDGCFTADSDIFLFGARTVYRDIFLGDGGYVVCYDMADIEEKLGFGRNSLIALALLLGSDYSQGVRGFGPETACYFIKAIGDSAVLENIQSGHLPISRKIQKNKKKGEALACNIHTTQDGDNVRILESNGISESCDQFLEVINAYLNPKCHSPDSEVVKRACVQLPFCHSLLQEACGMFFHWDSEKTDQYILPKIAERDLRRFADFRTSSEELGVRVSLQEMPVACPAFTIVKRRKLHGKECYEISWQVFGRLVTSTVPADLVNSACREKVSEFVERKAEGKKKQKRKPKLKKPEKAAIADVDLQLHSLILGLELEDGLHFKLTNSPTSLRPKEDIYVVDLSTPSPPPRACKMVKWQAISVAGKNAFDLASETCISPPGKTGEGFVERDADNVQHASASGNISSRHFDVIDLSPSPPPPGKHGKLPRPPVSPPKKTSCGVDSGGPRVTDVIEVCDSESDASPEHRRRARELRAFIGSIKSDLH